MLPVTKDLPSFHCPYLIYAEPTDKHPCENVETKDSKGMLRHILRMHVKHLQCNKCGMRFGGPYELKRHKDNGPQTCKSKAFEPVPEVAIDLNKELRGCKGQFESVLYPWAAQANWQTRYDFQDTNTNPTPAGDSDVTEQNEAGYNNNERYNIVVEFINEDMMQEPEGEWELDEEWELESVPELERVPKLDEALLEVSGTASFPNIDFDISMLDEELQPTTVDCKTESLPLFSPQYYYYYDILQPSYE